MRAITHRRKKRPLAAPTGKSVSPAGGVEMHGKEPKRRTAEESKEFFGLERSASMKDATVTPRRAAIASLYGERRDGRRRSTQMIDPVALTRNPYVWHPDQRRGWNMAVLAAVLYSAVEMPIVICFFECVTTKDWFFYTMCSLDAFFLLDIVFNFFTGYRDDGTVVMDRQKIARRYIGSVDFVIDCVSILPVSYISIGSACKSYLKTTRMFKVLRVFRLVRLFRLQRFFRYFAHLTEEFSVGIVRIVNLVLMLLMLTHWNACLYFMLGKFNSSHEEGWINQAGIADARMRTQYSVALFASWSQMLCIGYGTITPVLCSELWFTVWSMTSGYALFSGIVAAVTTVFMLADSSGQKYICHMNEVEAFMVQNEVPTKLRTRMREYMLLKYRIKEGSSEVATAPKMFDVDHIVSEFSIGIRRDLRTFFSATLARRVPFLASSFELPPEVSHFLLQRLQPELGLCEDVVIEQGEASTGIFFIEEGRVELFRGTVSLTRLHGGSYFGEMPFVMDGVDLQPMRVRVKSSSCKMHMLEAHDVEHLFHLFVDVLDLMHMVATQRIQTFGLHDLLGIHHVDDEAAAEEQLAQAEEEHLHLMAHQRKSVVQSLYDSVTNGGPEGSASPLAHEALQEQSDSPPPPPHAPSAPSSPAPRPSDGASSAGGDGGVSRPAVRVIALSDPPKVPPPTPEQPRTNPGVQEEEEKEGPPSP